MAGGPSQGGSGHGGERFCERCGEALSPNDRQCPRCNASISTQRPDPDQVANIFTDLDMTPTGPDSFTATNWQQRGGNEWDTNADTSPPIVVTAPAAPPSGGSKLAAAAVVLLGALVVVMVALLVVLSRKSDVPSQVASNTQPSSGAAAGTPVAGNNGSTVSPTPSSASSLTSSTTSAPVITTIRVSSESNRYRDPTTGFCLDMPTWFVADPSRQYDPLSSSMSSASDVASFRSPDGATQLVFAIESASSDATYDKWTALTTETGPTPAYRRRNDKHGGWVTSGYNGGKVVYVEGQYLPTLNKTVTFRYVFPPSKEDEMTQPVQRTFDGFRPC